LIAGGILLAACGPNKGSGNGDGGGSAIDARPLPPDSCVGLECAKVDCSTMGGGTTTLSGTVFAPNGTLPLYGVTVYVPNTDPGPITQGVTCDKCNDVLAGSPIAKADTDESGHFTLTDVPVSPNLPVIIQVGKWRRQITIPTVTACADTAIDPTSTRLPKNHTEGDMPQIALATGGADALECLLLKIGIDPAEITTGSENGKVHLYVGSGGASAAFDASSPGGARPMTSATDFWNTASNLDKYDIVLLSCEGSEYADQKSSTALQNVYDYANKGGRVFMSHYHYYWISAGPQPWPQALTLSDTGDFLDSITGTVDQTFDKGKALALWLVKVGASTTQGSLAIVNGRNIAKAINAALAQRYIYLDNAADPVDPTTKYNGPQISQFTTPLDLQESDRCGKVVYSDMHVSAAPTPTDPYPGECIDPLTSQLEPMSPQEKALAFMLFDISSCVGPIVN
jgi:hypothetical protein